MCSTYELFFIRVLCFKKADATMYVCPLFLKLSSISKLSILTTKFLVNIKTQGFYSCLILTENFLVNIKTQNFYSCLILTENFLGNIKTQIVFILTENFSDNILKLVVLSDEQPKSKVLPNFCFAKIRTYTYKSDVLTLWSF